jgi:hypothetical protein
MATLRFTGCVLQYYKYNMHMGQMAESCHVRDTFTYQETWLHAQKGEHATQTKLQGLLFSVVCHPLSFIFDISFCMQMAKALPKMMLVYQS